MPDPIRILHTEWSDGWGGQEIRIVEEMKAVRKLGVEPMLACRSHARIRERAQEAGIPVYSFPFRGNTDLSTYLGLVGLIRRRRIDIVNTHSGKDTWVGGLAAKTAGALFVRTRHLSNPINPSRLNFINSLADLILTTGESIRDAMIADNRIDPERILSVPTGIDEKRFDPSCCSRSQARSFFGLPEEKILIGNLAVLRRFKRHDLLIRAFERLHRSHPETLLVLAGEGPQRPALERLVSQLRLQESVIFLGHTPHPERFLRSLDLFVLSSDSKEGVPQSLIQSLMSAIPSVATDVGSVRDLYDDNFLLVPPGETQALHDAMRKLLHEPETAAALAARARSSVVPRFTTDTMARTIVRRYRELLR